MGVFITGFVVFGGLMALVSTLLSWTRGQARIDAELESQQSLRIVRDTLREAMVVTVDADGKGITYRLPSKNPDGSYVQPATWNGVTSRFFVNASNQLIQQEGATTRVLLTNLVFTDPYRTGSTAYLPFVAGSGTVTRTVTVQFVTQRMLRTGGEAAWGRVRERMLIRNSPSIIR